KERAPQRSPVGRGAHVRSSPQRIHDRVKERTVLDHRGSARRGSGGRGFKFRGPDWLKKRDLLKSVQEVARGVSLVVSFSLLRSDFSSRGTTPTAQNTA